MTDDEWADSDASDITKSPTEKNPNRCVIGRVVVEVGSVWLLQFYAAKFTPTAGVLSVAGTHPQFGFRLLGGNSAGRWVPASYVSKVILLSPDQEAIYRLGGNA